MSALVVGFIGTGVMGSAMAHHLIAKGHPLRVFNRTPARARALLDAGASWCDSPAAVARASQIVITIVGTPADVDATYRGPNASPRGITGRRCSATAATGSRR
jgi:3-hydroxyisobutyrate dehydrogenase